MRPEITFNPDLCVKCGLCAKACPTHHISITEDGPMAHHNRRCLLCMHCSAACPQKAIHFAHVPAFAEYPDTPEDETLKLIMTRRSIRRCKAAAPEAEDIAWALDIAQWAPSGKNRHLTKWLVIHTKEKCDALYNYVCDITAETGIMPSLARQRDKGDRDSITCGCSTILMALSPNKSDGVVSAESAETDAVIAMTTAELLLNKLGYGSCWGGFLTFFTNSIPQFREYLQVPEGYHVAGTLLCGIPDETYRNVPYRPKADAQWL